MATKDFCTTDPDTGREYVFVAGGRVTYNGVSCREWARYEVRSNCRVFCGVRLADIDATRDEIAGGFGNGKYSLA